MIFAVLFVIAFLVGLSAYLLTGKWLTAMLISTGLFVVNTLTDSEQSGNAFFTLVLGLPVVFFASLLGAYVVELRRGLNAEDVEQAQEADGIENMNSPEQENSLEPISSLEQENSPEQENSLEPISSPEQKNSPEPIDSSEKKGREQ